MCPFCQHPFSKVITTEHYGSFIRRRRRCHMCLGEYYGDETFAGMIKAPPNKEGTAVRKDADTSAGD